MVDGWRGSEVSDPLYAYVTSFTPTYLSPRRLRVPGFLFPAANSRTVTEVIFVAGKVNHRFPRHRDLYFDVTTSQDRVTYTVTSPLTKT